MTDPRTKNAFIAAAIAAGAGYWIAMSHARDRICKDAAFVTNATTIKTQCANLSTYDMIKYYENGTVPV